MLSCSECDYVGLLPLDWSREGRVELCPICGSQEFFRQKDFNQRLAVVIAIVGIVLGYFTKYVSVLIAGIAVLLLYGAAPEILVCYLCRAHIRGHLPSSRHRRFDRGVEERVNLERSREVGRQNSQKGVR